jgi:PGF-pre-PGF domain-containing protein
MDMRGSPAVLAACLVVLSASVVGLSGSVVADDEYEITIPGSVDTPTREVDIKGSTYDISAIAPAELDGSVDVDVTAPEDPGYRVYLYNGDGQQETTPGDGVGSPLYDDGDADITMDLTDIEAGTYAVTVQEEGQRGANFKTIHPVVIQGFDTSVADAPGSATVGDEITVDVSVDRVDEASDDLTNDRVEVVVANESEDIVEEASEEDGEYTATVDTSSLGPGSYDIYATVRGTEAVFGEDEVLGISDESSLELAAQDDSGSTETPSDNGGGGGGAAPAPAGETATPSGETATPSGETTTESEETTPNQQSTEIDGIEDVSGTEVVSETTANVTTDPDTGTSAATFESGSSVESVEFGSDTVDGSVTVAEVSEPPEETGSPPGSPAVVADIQVPEGTEDRPATVRMRVPADRLAERAAAAEDLRITRFHDGEWQRLETRIVEETEAGVTLEADTPGFSFFAASAVGEPDAELSVSPDETRTDTAVTLDATDSVDQYGDIVTYEWRIAGEELSGETASVTVDDPGEYTVELVVTNDAGETDTATAALVVEAADTATTAPGVMTPQPDAESPTEAPTQETSGFGTVPAVAAVAALLLIAAFVVFRYRS